MEERNIMRKYLVSKKLLHDERIDNYIDLQYYILATTLMDKNMNVNYDDLKTKDGWYLSDFGDRLEELGYIKQDVNMFLQEYLEQYHKLKNDIADVHNDCEDKENLLFWLECYADDMKALKYEYAKIFKKECFGVKVIPQDNDSIFEIETDNLEMWLRNYYNEGTGYKECVVCGTVFKANSNRQKYCPKCKTKGNNIMTNERMKKYRSKLSKS